MTAVVALTMGAVLFMSTVSHAACILTKYNIPLLCDQAQVTTKSVHKADGWMYTRGIIHNRLIFVVKAKWVPFLHIVWFYSGIVVGEPVQIQWQILNKFQGGVCSVHHWTSSEHSDGTLKTLAEGAVALKTTISNLITSVGIRRAK